MSLLESHFRVVAPDLWGFGLTDGWPKGEDLTHDHQASLVARVIEAVALGPVHLVGHSYGGATGRGSGMPCCYFATTSDMRDIRRIP